MSVLGRVGIAGPVVAGTVVTMAAKFRSVDDVIAAKELVDAGDIGEVLRERVRLSR